MDPNNPDPHFGTSFTSRRDFLKHAGAGFGMLGLAGLLSQEGALAEIYADPLAVRSPHFKP